MPLTYNPDDAVQVWPEGEYPATLVSVADRTFKSGSIGQEWVVKVYDNVNDRQITITDRVVVPGATFKVQDLALAVGEEDAFKKGIFQADDHVDASFIVALKIEKSDGYPDKNVIKKYKAKVAPANSLRPSTGAQRRPTNAERILNAPTKATQQEESPVVADADIPF